MPTTNPSAFAPVLSADDTPASDASVPAAEPLVTHLMSIANGFRACRCERRRAIARRIDDFLAELPERTEPLASKNYRSLPDGHLILWRSRRFENSLGFWRDAIRLVLLLEFSETIDRQSRALVVDETAPKPRRCVRKIERVAIV